MNYVTPSTKRAIPSFRFAPTVRRRVNQIRFHVDLAGVTLIRLLMPLVQNPMGHTLLSIYNMAAWVTILTVDPTRIPEVGTTRIQQRRSWGYALRWTPLLATILMVLTFGFHQSMFPAELSLGKIASAAIGAYFDELLFRNTLQPKLRQLGLPTWAAIGVQSTLYACAIWFSHASIPVVVSFWALGFSNGWIVYRFRSLLPAFALGLFWNVLWFA